VPLQKLFEYSLPEEIEAHVGDRVAVRFGAQQKIGVVIEEQIAPALARDRIKPISARRDDAPRLPADWIALMRFLSGYYQRPLGETVISALPPRLRSTKPLPKKVLKGEDAPSGTRFVQMHQLTDLQKGVVERVAAGFHAYLLHGVTGSGKTEVYLHLVARTLERGQQALVLVPEISLTPQLEARFRHAFPDTQIALMHSGLEDIARTGAWLAAARGSAGIVLGTRLAVLAPLARLGTDRGRRRARRLVQAAGRIALLRARRRGLPRQARRLPGDPRHRHALARDLAQLDAGPLRAAGNAGARFARGAAADGEDRRPETGPGGAGFFEKSIDEIATRLARREQSLIFINRRGYAPVLACEACGWTAGCGRCTARMVLHAPDRRSNPDGSLRCHHCGAQEAIPRACPTCGNVDLKPMGRGTQRVEETLAARFPDARIVRIDRDSARRREELSRTLEGIRRGEGDILVGTQLLAKGHDFPGLTLVGVLNADSALVSTDYRAPERLFAVLAQVAGRAGRRERPGEVLIQTRYPRHPLFAALERHDFAALPRRSSPSARAPDSRRSCSKPRCARKRRSSRRRSNF
jgi:primosomal protein N' (replication factor Y)